MQVPLGFEGAAATAGLPSIARVGSSPIPFGVRRMDQRLPPKPLVVLVVEDELLLRDGIVTYLRDAGCTVFEADTGESALEILRDGEPIDVVFTDIQLRGRMNGWDVGESFRAAHADMPVIYTSGCRVQPPREVTGSLFFHKPYDPRSILEACHELAQHAGPESAGQERYVH